MIGQMEEEKKTTQNSDKKKFPTWIIVVIVIVVVLLGGAYYGANLVKSRIYSSLPISVNEKDSTYKAKVGNVETVVGEKEIPWPAEIPGDLPKFQGGKIKAVTHETSTNTWVIAVGSTTQLEFNNYKTYLVNANWKAQEESNVLVNVAVFKKGESQVSVVFDPTSKGVLISLAPIK
jgi:hypothetical protein